jgi:hypothetical protein
VIDSPKMTGDSSGSIEFDAMALPVIDTEGVNGEAEVFGNGKGRRTIQTATEKNHGSGHDG